MVNLFRLGCAIFLTSACCGLGAWLFLAGLEAVTSLRDADQRWFFFAPLAGLLTGIVYSRLAPSVAHDSRLLVAQLRRPMAAQTSASTVMRGESAKVVPVYLAPLIVVATWISHLAGLSVGREGTAIQMGAGIAALSSRVLGVASDEGARLVLRVGLAAGFAAVFHVPWAAAIFALEVARGRFVFGKRDEHGTSQSAVLAWRSAGLTFFICLAGGIFADRLAISLGATHASFPLFHLSDVLSVTGFFALIASGVLFGLAAWLFLLALQQLKRLWAALIARDWLRPTIAGGLYVLMAFAPPGISRYAGLGAHEIGDHFTRAPEIWDWLVKLGFTVFALGTGFKGGEVTPLFFMGSSLGAVIASFFQLPIATFAGLGLVAVFAAAADLPVTCALMAAELFGPEALAVSLPVCFLASWVCRHSRLYDAKPDL